MNIILSLIRKFKLEYYLKDFLENNPAIVAPYHNLFHTFCVMENCYRIGIDEKINKEELRFLLIAGMFHDFGHSQGKKSDAINVQYAIAHFTDISFESNEDTKKINKLILATEYPYKIADKDLSQLQKIIKDADLMQVFEKNFLQQVWFGLAQQELKGTQINSLEQQIKFLNMVKFYTPYAQKVSDKLLESRIKSYKYLKNILED